MKPIALVDMDGTIADYDAAMRESLFAIRSPEETGPSVYHGSSETEPPYYRNRVRLIRRQAGWWEGLDKLQDGFEIVRMLRQLEFEVHVLTKGPASSPNAWSEKVAWCKQHLPGVPVTITDDKSLVYGRVLVDDWPNYVTPWLKSRPRGLVIMPDRPWNHGFTHDRCVRALVAEDGKLKNPYEVVVALQRARNRADGADLLSV